MTKLEELQELILEMSNPKGVALTRIDDLMPKTVLHLCKLACCLNENLDNIDKKKWVHKIGNWIFKINRLSSIKAPSGRLTFDDYVDRVSDRYDKDSVKVSITKLKADNYDNFREDYLVTVYDVQEEFLHLVTAALREFFEDQFKLISEKSWVIGKCFTGIEKFINSCYNKENDNES